MLSQAKQYRRELAQILGLSISALIGAVFVVGLIRYERPPEDPAWFELFSYLPATIPAFLLFAASLAARKNRPLSLAAGFLVSALLLVGLTGYIAILPFYYGASSEIAFQSYLHLLVLRLPVAAMVAGLVIGLGSFKKHAARVSLAVVVGVIVLLGAISASLALEQYNAAIENPMLDRSRVWWDVSPFFVNGIAWGLLLVAAMNPGRQRAAHTTICQYLAVLLISYGLARAVEAFGGGNPLWFLTGGSARYVAFGLIVFALTHSRYRDAWLLAGLGLVLLAIYQSIDGTITYANTRFYKAVSRWPGSSSPIWRREFPMVPS